MLDVATEAEVLCRFCLCVFRCSPSAVWRSAFCSDECRKGRRAERNRARDRHREGLPERLIANRIRNRAWAETHRNVRRVNPWLHGAPPFGPTLPCVALDISVDPLPKWPLQMRNMRGIHGAITGLLASTLGITHRAHTPTFAPRIHADGELRVVVWDAPQAAALFGGAYQGALWDRPTLFRVEDAVQVSSPAVTTRGRHRVRLTTGSPVVISSDGHSVPCTRPDADTIRRSLGGAFLERFGLQRLADGLRVETTAIETEHVRQGIGGKFPPFDGWVGHVDLVVNAPALWLLLAAEKVGFGSRTAFGFGQIQVEVR